MDEPSSSPLPAQTMSLSDLLTSNLYLLALSFAFGVLVLGFYLSRRGGSSGKGKSMLLLGPLDGGKTSILSSLIFGQALPTHTSLQVNTGALTLMGSKKPLKIVDIPGHPRLREQYREHLSDAKAVLFIIDSSTIARNGPIVAEHLHHILHSITSFPPSQKQPSILLVAHKADLVTSTATMTSSQVAISRIRTVLERELDKRSQSQKKTVAIERMGDEGEEIELGGLDCSGTGGFAFARWEYGEIEFVASFVKVVRNDDLGDEKITQGDEKSVDGMADLQNWLEQVAS